MLSIENPPTSSSTKDPSCSSTQISQLKINDEIDRVNSTNNNLVDLLPNTQQIPNFSIRDYVFAARSKDIKKTWPFSLKSLQLCLKHGVKDVLPPFQSVDAVRNQSIKTCTSEKTSSPINQNLSHVDAQPCEDNDNEVLSLADDSNAQLNHKPPDIKRCCKSGGENNDLPSTTTSVCQSEIESVHNNRPSSSSPPIETDNLLEHSVEAEAAVSRLSQKADSLIRLGGKKCRFVVKFGGNSDRSSTEDIASNCTTVSESMASKVCPVCRTFSSSSNTTLNAHIDQCLSIESTPKWTADSRLTRHRIKSRRTRLMVDIYVDAKMCTLEELDRRNGTSWASTANNMLIQDSEKAETATERIKHRAPVVHPEDSDDVGPVYIDESGTKVRILSKFNDEPPVSKIGVDLGPKKSLKGSKRSKLLSAKKNKLLALRQHQKYLKFAAQNKKKFYSSKTHTSQISGLQERRLGKGENSMDVHQILTQWACSKRSGLSRKNVNQDGRQLCKWNVKRDLVDGSDQSCLGDKSVGRNRIQKFTNLSENVLSKRNGKAFYGGKLGKKRGRSSKKNRVGAAVADAGRSTDDVERSLPPMKRNFIRLSNDRPSVYNSGLLRSSSLSRTGAPSTSDEVVYTCSTKNSDVPPIGKRKPPLRSHATTLKTSSRKKVLSVPETEPRYGLEKCSTFRTDTHVSTETDEDVEPSHSEGTENQYGMEEITDEMSLDCSDEDVFTKEKRAVHLSPRNEKRAFKHLQPTFQSYSTDDDENSESSAGASDYSLDKVGGGGTFEASVVGWRKSMDAKLSGSYHSVDDYGGPLYGGEALTAHTEPGLVDGENIFCSREDGDGVIGQHDHMRVESDTEAGEANCFPEVDPIPIPGPPGSFLPSPRDMGSDDFPGNSSLTTSRVHSSHDQHELVDVDSSDSPVSATSSILNPTARRSDLKFSEPSSSVGTPTVQDTGRSGFSTASIGSLVENAATVPQTSSAATTRMTADGENFKLNKISFEKRPRSFRNDDEPCCCQRKERLPQDVTLNFQESQLLKRRAMNSVMISPMKKQLDCNLNDGFGNLDIRPENFLLKNPANLEPAKAAVPVLKPSAGSVPFKGSVDSASPSASNPVLRLMGKNLMVVNKDDDASMPVGQTQSCAQINHLTSHYPTPSGISPSNMRDKDGNSYYHMFPQGSVDSARLMGRCFGTRLANNYQGVGKLQVPQTPSQVPAGSFLDQHLDSSFTNPVEHHKLEGDCLMSSPVNRSKNRINIASVSDQLQETPYSENASGKEIIVIDDGPVGEDSGFRRFSEGLKESQLSASGIPMPTVGSYNARPSTAFTHFRSQGSPLSVESPVALNSSYHTTAFRTVNDGPARWNCTPEGYVLLPHNSFINAPPSSTGLMGSPLYYSPRFQ